ncbi:MAG: serine/threonine-protein kinase [Prosthecobacter sp.]
MSHPPPEAPVCTVCDTPLPGGMLGGKCPTCLRKVALAELSMLDDTRQLSPVSSASPSSVWSPPPFEEVAALLPEGAYSVEGCIGWGGMGAVYKGTQLRLRRPVAIKIMRQDQSQDAEFKERFLREAHTLARLSHPGIVNVIDCGEAGTDLLYIIMEFVDGADLMNVLRSGDMTQETALTLLPQICDALQFAHDHGIVHRDIKPSNILLTRDGRVKIADFGLAKALDRDASLQTRTGIGLGTPDYAAPEQFMGEGNVDHRADIYALGVMIYQMITGQLPRGAWKPPSEKAAVDSCWDHIVARALQTDPHERYASVSEIKTDLGGITSVAGKSQIASEDVGDRKKTGTTGGKSTALTQAGGRPVTKALQPTGPNDVLPTKSRRVRAPAIIAIVLAVSGYFTWKLGDTPVETAKPALPAPVRLWDTPEKVLERYGTLENGILHLNPDTGAYYHDVAMRDVIYRGKLRMNPDAFLPNMSVRIKQGADGSSEYALKLYQGTLQFVWNDPPKSQLLGSWPLPRSYGPDEFLPLELRAIGDKFTVIADGKLLGTVQNGESLHAGKVGIWNKRGSQWRDMEVVSLDGHTLAAPATPVSTPQIVAAPTWTAPAPTITVGTEWTNLVPHIQPQRDAICGEWSVDEKGLHAKRLPWALCNIPVQDPGTDYDLRYKVTRGEGSHLAMFFLFRKGDTGGMAPVDYVESGKLELTNGMRIVGLESVKNTMFRPSSGLKQEWLPRGKACTVVLQVREKEVILMVDDVEALRWEADWSQIRQMPYADHPMFKDTSGAPIFGVGIYNCEATFHSIEMRRVSPPSASMPAAATK